MIRSLVECFQDVLGKERAALNTVEKSLALQPETIEHACRILAESAGVGGSGTRTVVSGVGKAGLIARKVAATLSSTGTAATFLHPVEALHGDLGFVHSSDSGLLFSYSGETMEVVRLAGEMRRIGCRLIAVTRSRESSLGTICTACIEMGDVDEACYFGLAPTSSTTAMLAIGDALALTVARASGFEEQDFARNHPAGTLGLHFRSVRSEMREGARLVCVRPELRIAEVVRAVSQAKTGAAVVTREDGTLLGIFTDGDLRRALLHGGAVLDREVFEFATQPCHAVPADSSLAEAMRLFGQTRIEDLPVVDASNRVVGLLCLKDISAS